MNTVFVFITTFILSGCLGALQDFKVDRATSRCESYGFKIDTPEMSKCISDDRNASRSN